MPEIGPHLLGRKPSPPDERDWKLAPFLDDPVAAAIAELKQTTVGYRNKYWQEPPSNTHWRKAMAYLGVTYPVPAPTSDVQWTDVHQLDQGNTGHCVGFGWAQWGNTAPVDDSFVDDDGHAIYYECKVIDGEPDEENGSYVRSGAKAMQARNRLSAYAFAATVDEVVTWVSSKGPVVVGTNWYYDMFEPDTRGLVTPTGDVAGGHCYLAVGVIPGSETLIFQNSWGAGWGVNGYFLMTYTGFEPLLSADGEAVATIELPI